MQQSLDISSSIPLSSAHHVAKGGSKTESTDTVDNHFAELLHQAQGKSETPSQSQAASTSAPAHKSETNNVTPSKTFKENATAKPVDSASRPTKALKSKASPSSPANAQAEAPKEASPNEVETPISSTSGDGTPQIQDQATDKTETITPEDLLALAVTVQPQPINLAVLQAAAPLLAQPQINFNAMPQPTEALASEASAPITASAAIPLPQAASQIALMPGLLVDKSQQQDGAFTLPTGSPITSSPALDPLNPNLPVGKDQKTKLEDKLENAASPSLSDTQTVAISGQPAGAANNTSSALNIPSLPLSPQVPSEGTMETGDLTRQAIGPMEGLTSGLGASNGVGKSTPTNSKPNATLPTSDNFKKSLSSVQDNFKALNGEIETSPQAKKDLKEALPEQATVSTDSSTLSASDLLTATGLSESTATAVSENTTNAPNGIPQFASAAQNPTDQVAEGTAYSIKNGHKELIIRLNPDNLGEVRINLTSHGNQELSARLIASTQESHDLLKGQLESLRNTLQSQGVTVERLSVVLAGHTESSNSNPNSDQPTFQQQQQTSQQGSFQQQFNQQNPSSNGLFNLMGGQHQSSFSQNNQTQSQAGSSAEPSEIGMDGINPSGTVQPTSHDNGRISLLA